jgi:phosphopantetheinyl transferase
VNLGASLSDSHQAAVVVVCSARIIDIVPVDDLDAAVCSDVLSAAEYERARCIRSTAARVGFIAGRLLVRHCLGEQLGCSAKSVPIQITPTGKLEVAASCSKVFFSLSHSTHNVALAFSLDGEVGLDVEEFSRAVDIRAVAEMAFSAHELRLLAQADGGADAFFTIWTAKEAVAKAAGRGFRDDPRSFGLFDTLAKLGGSTVPARDHGGKIWWVRAVRLGDMICSIAAEQPGFRTTIRLHDTVTFGN